MTLDQIKILATQEESDILEFKQSTSELQKACKTLCGFLNSQGGVLLIGIKKDGRLVGQMVSDNTRLEIAKEIRKFEPPISMEIDYVSIDAEKYIISIQVPAASHQPYVYDGRPYQRIESSTSVMPQHLYEQLLVERGQLNHSWEEYLSTRYHLEDLDEDGIHSLIKQGSEAGRIPDEARNHNITDILSSLELIENGTLKNAAIVLFAKKVTPLYPQCMLKMARFRGLKETDDFLDNQQFYGNAFKILEEADNFMRRHLSIASFYQTDSFVRIDRPTLPILAVREAIINAICHKDYTERSSAITLAIFDDRMEIWNYGLLPRVLKIEDLKNAHKSYPRNKFIANAFYKKGLIESWGTGTVKMFEKCREHGMPPPIFSEYSGGVSVTFMFAEPIQRIGDTSIRSAAQQKTLAAQQLNLRQQEIFHILAQFDELKLPDILEKLQHTLSERTLRRNLNALKKLGILGSHGRGRNAVWFKL
ncbi:MAG: putative transcriptional regulator [Gammaproteobacteria bacterium]|nr:putative transcriptional regulator [Gammaproteobacteria bacterium]